MENNLKDIFVPYAESMELKQLGFEEECLGAWGEWGFMTPNDVSSLSDYIIQEDLDERWIEEDNVCLAPTYSQAFRWFRENYNLFHEINVDKTMEPKFAYTIIEYESAQFVEGFKEDTLSEHLYYNHEEAELACVRKLIEIVKNKQS
jgi:hypothetical protein